MAQGGGHIFISYARQDGKEFAERLESDLNGAGFEVWRDKTSLHEGSSFPPEIESAIQDSLCVVVVLTPSIQKSSSSWVRREIGYAERVAEKVIIPLIFPGGKPVLDIVNLDYIEFATRQGELRYDSALTDLIVRLRKLRDAQSPREETRQDPYRPYVNKLMTMADAYLKPRVFSLVSAEPEEAPGLVAAAPEDDGLLSIFETFLGSSPQADGAALANGDAPATYTSFQEAFDRNGGRLLVLGEPGMGKTIALMHFTREAARRRLEDPAQPLPLYLPIASWQPQHNPSSAEKPDLAREWLVKALPSQSDALVELIKQGKVLLILDALDELGKERPVSYAKKGGWGNEASPTSPAQMVDPDAPLQTRRTYDPRELFIECFQAQIPDQTPVVLSCRVKDYDDLQGRMPLNRAVRLPEWSDEQIQTYLSGLPSLWEALQANPGLLEVVRKPLLLSLFREGFQQLDSESRDLTHLGEGDLRDTIFEQVFRRRYEREAEKLLPLQRKLPFTLDELRVHLEALALENLLASGEEGVVSAQHIERVVGDHQFADFAAVVRLLDLLTPQDDRDEKFRFLHLLLRDFFAYAAARHQLNQPDADARTRAINALINLSATDPRAAVDLIDVLPTLSGADQSETRRRIVDALAGSGSPAVVETLMDAARYDADAGIRALAARGLGRLGQKVAVTALVELLADDDVQTRYAALHSLSHLDGETEAAPELIRLLEDSAEASYGFRRQQAIGDTAVELLRHIPAEQVLEPLQRVLRSGSADARARAAQALAAMEDERTVPALIAALADDSPAVRHAALRGLAELKAPDAVEAILRLLDDPESDLQVEAADVLGEMGDVRAVEPLVARLNRSDLRLRVKAAEALGALGDPRAVDPLLALLPFEPEPDAPVPSESADEHNDDDYFEVVVTSTLADVRKAARGALEKLAPERLVQTLIEQLRQAIQRIEPLLAERAAAVDWDLLLQVFSDDQSQSKELNELVDALGDAGQPALEPVLGLALAEDDLWMRLCQAQILGLIGGSQAVDLLVSRLNDRHPYVRFLVAIFLGDEKDSRVLDTQLEGLQQPNLPPDISIRLLSGLKTLADPRAVPAAAALLGDDRADRDGDTVADAAGEVLAAVGEPALETLIGLLRSEDRALRRKAAAVLGEIDSPRVISTCIRLIDDPDDDTALTAIRTLEKRTATGAVMRLAAALDNRKRSLDVRRGALKALAAMHTQGSVAPIFVALGDEEDALALDALKALVDAGQTGDSRLTAPLPRLLVARDVHLCVLAAKTLAQRGALEYLDEMIHLIRDPRLDDDMERGGLFDHIEEMVKTHLPPIDGLAHWCKAISHLIDGEYEAAVSQLDIAVRLQPNRWFHWYWRSELLDWAKRNLPQALSDSREALRLGGDREYIYRHCGVMCYRQAENAQDYEAAADYLRTAARMGPTNPNNHHWLGWAQIELKQYAEAVESFEKAIQYRPAGDDLKNDYSGRANARLKMGDTLGALEDYHIAQNMNMIGVIYFRCGDYPAAVQALTRSISEDKDARDSYLIRGFSHLRLGDVPAALEDLTANIQQDPDQNIRYYWRALAHLCAGDMDAARADLDREMALTQANDYTTYAYDHIWRGAIALRRSETETASTHFEAARQAIAKDEDPKDRARAEVLVHVLTGDLEAARAAYEFILPEKPNRNDYFAPPIYLLVAAKLFPERAELAAFERWFDERLGPVPALPRFADLPPLV